MKRGGIRLLLVASALVGPATPVFAQQGGAAAIVNQFYPPILTAFPDEIGGREQCFAVYDADASGAPRVIVAAYTNHTEAVVRVLRNGGAGFDVAAEPAPGLDMTGVWCTISLEDVDADGRNEIRVDFSVNRDVVSWLFQWDGQQLVNLTPTTPTATGGYQASNFVNGDLVDVDNDGTKEIYIQPRYPVFPDEAIEPPLVYRLSGGVYGQGTPLLGLWKFVRSTSTPETSTVNVSLPQGAQGPYTLRVVSGRPDGSLRATSAQVWINGVEILSSSDFGNNVALIQRAVTLAADNELAVRFAGQPASEMQIFIESAGW